MTETKPVRLYNQSQIGREINKTRQNVYHHLVNGNLPDPKYIVGETPLWDEDQLNQIKKLVDNKKL